MTWIAEIKKHINTTWIKSNKIDIEGLKSILKPECMTCNLSHCESSTERDICAIGSKCPFIHNSKSVGDAQRILEGKKPYKSRCGVSSFLSEFGFPKDKLSNYGKSQIYLFIHYPSLGFGYPPVPPFDLFAQVNSNSVDSAMVIDYKKLKQMRLAIHHINGDDRDDRKHNQALVINTEHTKIEHMNPYKAKLALNAVARRNLCLYGETYCPTFTEDQLNNDDFDRIIRGV